MKILFTGASSFTGMWFVKALVSANHNVTAIFQKTLTAYSGLRLKRVEQLLDICEPVFECSYGSNKFLKLIDSKNNWDLFCHHAADVTNYKSSDFNYVKALENNTKNIEQVLKRFKDHGCSQVLLTGSVFEQDEGAGSDDLRAVSAYGLSKGLTTDVFKYFTSVMQMKLGKFVIPNPFGPYEEPRYTHFLMKTWKKGENPVLKNPAYVRDNIHVSLLAKAYVHFTHRLSDAPLFEKFNPSGYRESLGAFTERFANEMRKRLSMPCRFELKKQTEFPEPKERVNTDSLNYAELKWNESTAWDELARYYES